MKLSKKRPLYLLPLFGIPFYSLWVCAAVSAPVLLQKYDLPLNILKLLTSIPTKKGHSLRKREAEIRRHSSFAAGRSAQLRERKFTGVAEPRVPNRVLRQIEGSLQYTVGNWLESEQTTNKGETRTTINSTRERGRPPASREFATAHKIGCGRPALPRTVQFQKHMQRVGRGLLLPSRSVCVQRFVLRSNPQR